MFYEVEVGSYFRFEMTRREVESQERVFSVRYFVANTFPRLLYFLCSCLTDPEQSQSDFQVLSYAARTLLMFSIQRLIVLNLCFDSTLWFNLNVSTAMWTLSDLLSVLTALL